MRNWIVIVLVTLGLIPLSIVGLWRLSGSRSHQLIGDLAARVDTRDSLIALTFDDGPHPVFTDSVLAVLDSFGVPATFFMVGSAMERSPDVVARVVRAGHELGNHSTTHARLVLESQATIRHEIEHTDSLIRAASGQTMIYVRPPYGKRLLGLPLYLRRAHRPVVMWNLEPDTFHPDADGMVRYVSERAVPGSILLLHVELRPRAEGRAALPRIIAELAERGFRFVTLSELLAAGAS